MVGAFLESGSPEENASLKKLALEEPAAPSTEDLAKQGLQFAATLGMDKPTVKSGGCTCM